MDAVKTLDFAFLIPLALGVIFGVVAITKLLETLLTKKPRQTYLMIIGFVVASMIEVFPGIPNGIELLICPILFILGFILIRFVSEKYGD